MLPEGGRIALDLDGSARFGEDDKITKASKNWQRKVKTGDRGTGLRSQLYFALAVWLGARSLFLHFPNCGMIVRVFHRVSLKAAETITEKHIAKTH